MSQSRSAEQADVLRRASVLARQRSLNQGHVEDPEMAFALADLFSMGADHEAGRGIPCPSCLDQTVAVARRYLGEGP